MILYREVATDYPAETHGQLQTALVASEPHQRRWHARRLPDDLHPVRALALLHDASSISSPLVSLFGVASTALTEASLATTYRRVQHVQLVCEPVAYFISTSEQTARDAGELTEAEFLARLLTRTGCGWLANVTQLHNNSLNFGFDPYEFLAEVLPCAARVQIELSEGGSIPAAVWDLYRFASHQARGKLEAVYASSDAATLTRLMCIDAEMQSLSCARRKLLTR